MVEALLGEESIDEAEDGLAVCLAEPLDQAELAPEPRIARLSFFL